MSDNLSSRNPYAPPTQVSEKLVVPVKQWSRAEKRLWMVNAAILIAVIPAGFGALSYIRSIAFVALVLAPVCVIAVIVTLAKRLPRVLCWIPSVLFAFIVIVFAVINVWNMSPGQAQVPIGRACAGMALAMQVGWILIYRFQSDAGIPKQSDLQTSGPKPSDLQSNEAGA